MFAAYIAPFVQFLVMSAGDFERTFWWFAVEVRGQGVRGQLERSHNARHIARWPGDFGIMPHPVFETVGSSTAVVGDEGMTVVAPVIIKRGIHVIPFVKGLLR